ncbi:MAG: hypothetical protein VCA36_02905, partial [Opitutales bacterium]
MYLPTDFIQKRLEEHGFFVSGDMLYVSSEHGCSKASEGRLFEVMLKRESISPDSVLHMGDDENGDVTMANARGLRVQPFVRGRLSVREKALADEGSLGPRLLRSQLAGASRLARLDCPHPMGDPQQRLWCMVCESVAPAFFGFVREVLKRAKEQGLDRLLFMGRDGQIFLRIAEFLTAGTKDFPTLQYVYGSRLAWSPTSFLELGERGLDEVFRKTHRTSVRLVFSRIGLMPEKLTEQLLSSGFPPEKWQRDLSLDERSQLRALLRSEKTRQALLAAAEAATAEACAYLRSLGIGQKENLGFVDLGWSGRLFANFDLLSSEANLNQSEAPVGFFFGLKKDLPPSVANRSFGFISSPDSTPSNSWVFAAATWLEAFASADHGSTVSYEDGRPILSTFPASNLRSVNTTQEAVLAYSRQLCANLE